MYTVQIGKQFLELYNQKMGTALTPMQFFDQVYWQLFFNCEDEKHLFIVTNSKFFHPSIAKAYKDTPKEIPMARKIAFLDQIDNCVKGNEPITGGIAVGFMASSSEENTSGQVSDVKINLSKEDILCSWIGGSLGIGIGGGVDLLTEDSQILWFIYQGWEYYRKLMNDTPNLKGRQLQGWNGLWFMLGYRYRNDFEKAYESLTNQINTYISQTGNISKLERPDWYQQIIHWALIESGKSYLVYGYNFGQMNRTYGFFNINLPEIRKPYQFYNELLDKQGGDDSETDRRFETVFKAQYSMERAIQTGGIGLRALTPKDLYKFVGKPDFPKTDKNNLYTFYIYISWLKAMLANDQTLALADRLASTLKDFSDTADPNARAGKTDRLRKVETLWEAKSRQNFINGLDELLQDKQPPDPETLNDVVQNIMLHIPTDQFTLFQTLVKFQFHYLKTRNQ